MSIRPDDALNRELMALVAPADWANPTPDGRYNLVVIGGGTAGLIASLGAAGMGAKVALIEDHMMGGDCLNWGCVPSKALIRSARAAHDARTSERFGVSVGEVSVDFGRVMERMRELRTEIAHHDSFERVQRDGVDVYRGRGRFTGPDTVEVAGTTLRFAKAVIATGARAWLPPIPGIDAVGALTNETVFQLTELPARLLVVGAGPIGCELAQTFGRFGSAVTLVDREDRVLPRDDPDASAIVGAQLESEGLRMVLGSGVDAFEVVDGVKRARIGGEVVEFDAVLVSVGRRANTSDLGLEAAGVVTERGRLQLDPQLRTTNRRIFAAGDVAGLWQFTHAADWMARTVLRNALFFGRKQAASLVIPWATYTEPEVAHVGVSHEEATAQGLDCTRVELGDVDRSKLEGDRAGFAKVYTDARGRVRGATIVAKHAGEHIAEVSQAMASGGKMGQLAHTIRPYPTQSEIWGRVGGAWFKTKFTPLVARIFAFILRIQR